MAISRIKKGDQVKIIAGGNKGHIGAVQGFVGNDKVLVAGIGERKRHSAANRVAPAGKRDIQLPIHSSNVALIVDEKTKATSRVGYQTKTTGEKTRVARQAKNKEIK